MSTCMKLEGFGRLKSLKTTDLEIPIIALHVDEHVKRKNFHSINIQGICDANYVLLWNLRWKEFAMQNQFAMLFILRRG